MGRYVVDIDKYATLARQTAAEGCVLVKNENQTLPLRKGDKVAVFGWLFTIIKAVLAPVGW